MHAMRGKSVHFEEHQFSGGENLFGALFSVQVKHTLEADSSSKSRRKSFRARSSLDYVTQVVNEINCDKYCTLKMKGKNCRES